MTSKKAISLLLFLIVLGLVFFVWNPLRSSRVAVVANIGLYAGRGTWNDSVQACQAMFAWMNYSFVVLSAEDINNGGFENCSALCIPGGDMYAYSQDISSAGKENIRRFIQEGGGYIGICGGAYFAAEKVEWRGSQLEMATLHLFSGTASGPIEEIAPYPEYTMCKVDIVNHVHPITRSENDSMTILYYWGPAFSASTDSNVTILGCYEKGNRTAILAFPFYQGRVFLIGTHPEIEEGNSRDGVQFGNDLIDPDSEWNLMLQATSWSIRT